MADISMRFSIPAGRLVARSFKQFLRESSWMRGLSISIFEEPGFLDILFYGDVSGPEDEVNAWCNELNEAIDNYQRRKGHGKESQKDH
jgi:hypothetical protein